MFPHIGRLNHLGDGSQFTTSSLGGKFQWQSSWGCDSSMPVLSPHAQVRFIGKTTGVPISHAHLVIDQAVMTVTLGLVYLYNSDNEQETFHVLAEFSIDGTIGVRRSMHSADYWQPRRWPGQNVPIDFGGNLCNRFATVTRPDGVQFVEELLVQARMSDSERWATIPGAFRWRGLSAPGPWANPAWENRSRRTTIPATCRGSAAMRFTPWTAWSFLASRLIRMT